MKLSSKIILSIFLFFTACTTKTKNTSNKTSWCDQRLRTQFSILKEVQLQQDWFKVYVVGDRVYAIAEPFNFQEVISYLVLGSEKALLFDSGMGMASIKSVTEKITDLPVMVINSHTHYDHIGGNYEFDTILAMDTPYTINRATNGISHKRVAHELAEEALCLEKIPELDTLNYKINPFSITTFIKDGSIIELGKRNLKIIAVPGHTPDAIALLDEENGYLWTGDTFYEAPIWLFDPETKLNDYHQSIKKLADLSSKLKKVFPAHNTPIAEPVRLVELVNAYEQIINGVKKAVTSDNDNTSLFEFEHFSFMIRSELLNPK